MKTTNDLNFAQFLEGLEALYPPDDTLPLKVTAHSSSISTDDWERMQAALPSVDAAEQD